MAKSGKEPDIGDWRNRIDALDLELVRMLNERARCAIEIGKIKRKRNMPIYDPKREEQIIATAMSINEGPPDGEEVRRLFERIIEESRRIEKVTTDKSTKDKNIADS